MDYFSKRSEPPIYYPDRFELKFNDNFSIKHEYKMTHLFDSPEERLRIMDENGIDTAVLSLSPGIELLDDSTAIREIRKANEYTPVELK